MTMGPDRSIARMWIRRGGEGKREKKKNERKKKGRRKTKGAEEVCGEGKREKKRKKRN